MNVLSPISGHVAQTALPDIQADLNATLPAQPKIPRSVDTDELRAMIRSHFRAGKLPPSQARLALAKERRMTSLIDREFATITSDFQRTRENYVTGWLDHGQTVQERADGPRAVRSISDHGILFWMVFHPQKRLGYHSLEPDPFAALDEASGAWARRRFNRRHWGQVRQYANDLILGRAKAFVSWNDALQSPLCPLGSHYFMHRFGLSGCAGVSGRSLALAFRVDPQIGHILADRAMAPR